MQYHFVESLISLNFDRVFDEVIFDEVIDLDNVIQWGFWSSVFRRSEALSLIQSLLQYILQLAPHDFVNLNGVYYQPFICNMCINYQVHLLMKWFHSVNVNSFS